MRLNEERSFHAPDGTSLFYRYWPATAGSHEPRGIILLHRGHEHSGRMQASLWMNWKCPGSQCSPGMRGAMGWSHSEYRSDRPTLSHLCQRSGCVQPGMCRALSESPSRMSLSLAQRVWGV